MKTKITQLTATTLFALLVLVGNVNAKGTELDASGHESIEQTLELENWMVNDNFWETDSETTFFLEQAIETNMELESWMTSQNTWIIQVPVTIETETEQDLAMEPWMTNENIWIR